MRTNHLAIAVLVTAALPAQAEHLPVANKIPRPPVVEPDIKTPAQIVHKAALPDGATVAELGVGAAGVQVRRRPLSAPLANALGSVFADPNLVLFDQPVKDGPLFFQGGNYKAVFRAGDWSFVAQPAAGAPGAVPIRFRPTQCAVGNESLDVDEVAPVQGDRRVEYRHPGFVELVDMHGRSVEQSFRFDSLPQRGELRITIAADTERHGEDRGDGIVFRSDFGDVIYSEAVAIDAAGARVVAATEFADGQITITVPASFVVTAKLPLVVDPVVTSTVVYSLATALLAHPDIAWEEVSHSWAVVFERQFSADDRDVYVQFLQPDMTPFGPIAVIDATLDLWQLPKIAFLSAAGRGLVVAQVSVDAPAPYWIAGRVIDLVGTLATGQFDIARDGVTGHHFGDKVNPDVGGDPDGQSPTYFTVVWERIYSAADHDIHLKQVTDVGVLRSPTPTIIDNSSSNERRPSISNSDGPGPWPDQRFVVAYQRAFNTLDDDIRGALLTWDGQIVQVGTANSFWVDTSAYQDLAPQVSTPTDGSGSGPRRVMFAYYRSFAGTGDIAGTVVAINGTILAADNLTVLEGDPVRVGWHQTRPSIDSDGVRFAVAYNEILPGPILDFDTRVSLFGFNPNTNTISAHEPGVALGTSSDVEFNAQIASVYSLSGVRGTGYGVVQDRHHATHFDVEAFRYEGLAPGGVFVRPTACGGLPINTYGAPVIGQTVDISVNTAHPVAGFVFGTPLVATPITPCPACLLGVNGSAVIVNPLQFVIPPAVAYVGITMSVQGFTFGGGPCLGQISTSDTVDMVIQ